MTTLKPHQVVCIEEENTYLYGEVIQVIEERSMCWVRPWILLLGEDEFNVLVETQKNMTLYNLSQTADLVCPLDWFRPALDTELIPLLSQTKDTDVLTTDVEEMQQGRKQLNSFLNKLWKARFKSLNRASWGIN